MRRISVLFLNGLRAPSFDRTAFFPATGVPRAVLFGDRFCRSFFFVSFPGFDIEGVVQRVQRLRVQALARLVSYNADERPRFIIDDANHSRVAMSYLYVVRVGFSRARGGPIVPFTSATALHASINEHVRVLLRVVANQYYVEGERAVLATGGYFRQVQVHVQPFIAVAYSDRTRAQVFVSVVLEFMDVRRYLYQTVAKANVLRAGQRVDVFQAAYVSGAAGRGRFEDLVVVHAPGVHVFSGPSAIDHAVVGGDFVNRDDFAPWVPIFAAARRFTYSVWYNANFWYRDHSLHSAANLQIKAAHDVVVRDKVEGKRLEHRFLAFAGGGVGSFQHQDA